MLKKIEQYAVISHGVDSSDYFQGCGTYGTKFNISVTGIGESEREAAEDALEQLHMSESVSDNENLIQDCQELPDDGVDHSECCDEKNNRYCERHYFVSIQARLTD